MPSSPGTTRKRYNLRSSPPRDYKEIDTESDEESCDSDVQEKSLPKKQNTSRVVSKNDDKVNVSQRRVIGAAGRHDDSKGHGEDDTDSGKTSRRTDRMKEHKATKLEEQLKKFESEEESFDSDQSDVQKKSSSKKENTSRIFKDDDTVRAVQRRVIGDGSRHDDGKGHGEDDTDGRKTSRGTGRIKEHNFMAKKPGEQTKTLKRTPRESKEQLRYTCRGNTVQLVILIISVTVIVFYSRNFRSVQLEPNIPVQTPKENRFERLNKELAAIREKYAELGDDFWDLIAGSSWSHMLGERPPDRPVVLMLAGHSTSPKLHTVASDVAKLFAKVFTASEESFIAIDGEEQALKEHGQAKWDMDQTLSNGFNSSKKVALITRFDKLPPCSIMLFHSYCDSDYAPFTDAVLLFTVQLQNTLPPDAGQKDVEESVQEHLSQLWAQCPKELFPDKITAMHSRVSNNIVFVT